MAPTICSGKKRQTRTIATTNIRRHGQGSHQLNQTFSNIVNFVASGTLNPKVPASLRIQPHNQTERNTNTTNNYQMRNNEAGLRHPSTASASSHQQHVIFATDNAVASLTHSDSENSLDLRLAKEISNNDSSATYNSNTTDTSNILSHKEEKASPASHCQKRPFQRYSTTLKATNLTLRGIDGIESDSEEADLQENDTDNKLKSEKTSSELNPNKKRKVYFPCSDFDSDEEGTRQSESDVGAVGSDTEMETEESDSMTSLDTEKSAELKKGNHPLLRDKLPAKQLNNNLRNTNGLLSIAIKTIKLVKRNQLLQQSLTQLQLETSEFIQSVLANPENRHFRENIEQKV